jgi:hypothetical protein
LTPRANAVILGATGAMKEKINEYPIERPINAARRKKINEFIDTNADRLGRAISCRWDEGGTVLTLASDPVEWEFVFHPDRVESFGSAPFWVKMLFTEKRRKTVDMVVLQMLDEAGFMTPKAPRKKASGE